MNAAKQRELFEHSSVTNAILRMAIPTVIGQIILVIYNMADTFYIGQTGNDAMITAVTVCMPAFMFLSAISNLFGVGGASVISRALGKGSAREVSLASCFAFWGCLAVTALYSLLAFLGRDLFVDLLGGTNPEAHRAAVDYLLCTVVLGGCVTSTGVLVSHLVRAEGRALHASIGIALGGILNIILDPIFIFVLLPSEKAAMGAALATSLSNLVSLLYFVAIMMFNRRHSFLSFRFTRECFTLSIPSSIFIAGIPACVMTLFENISYAVLDKLMSFNGIQMQAGIGVAKKVNMLAHCTVRGIAQGSLPLIGYNYAAKNYTRMRKSIRVSHNLAVGTAAVCMIVSLVWAKPLIQIFIHHASASQDYGKNFLRILCVGGPFSASAYTYISFFQATGEGKKSFLLAILRKGVVDIPLMFILQLALPVFGIVLATPLADAVCCVAANLVFAAYIKNLNGGMHAQHRLHETAQLA